MNVCDRCKQKCDKLRKARVGIWLRDFDGDFGADGKGASRYMDLCPQCLEESIKAFDCTIAEIDAHATTQPQVVYLDKMTTRYEPARWPQLAALGFICAIGAAVMLLIGYMSHGYVIHP